MDRKMKRHFRLNVHRAMTHVANDSVLIFPFQILPAGPPPTMQLLFAKSHSPDSEWIGHHILEIISLNTRGGHGI